MRKTLKVCAMSIIFVFILTQLAACSYKVKGKYKNDDTSGTSTIYEFSGKKVSRTVTTELESKNVQGDYEIRKNEDGGFFIIFDFISRKY